MQKFVVKIPRQKQRIKVVRAQDILNRDIEERRRLEEEERLKNLIIPEPELPEIEIKSKPKREQFAEYFSISNANQPLQISLKNIPVQTISINEARIEIQRAYDQGFNDGKETTDAEYKAEISKYEDWIRRIDAVVLEIKDKFLDEAKKFEDLIVDTAIMIATDILDREIKSDNEILINQVRKAIAELEEEEILSIHLHPEDIEILENSKSILTDDKKKLENVKLVPNNSVDKGGCILKSPAGNIDTRIKTQLMNISKILKKSLLDDDDLIVKKIEDAALDLNESSMSMIDQIKATDSFDSDVNYDQNYEDFDINNQEIE